MLCEVFGLTWTAERYTCDATPVHSPYYWEFPSVLSTIQRDVVYGVSFGLGSFAIDPFPGTDAGAGFAWRVGALEVEYAPPLRACFDVPVAWAGGLGVTVTGLAAGAKYRVGGWKAERTRRAQRAPPQGQEVEADGHGAVRFHLSAGQGSSACVDRI